MITPAASPMRTRVIRELWPWPETQHVIEAAAEHESERREALLGLLEAALARGHQKIAVRRYLMLKACGFEVPLPAAERCLHAARACSAGQFLRIKRAVDDWMELVAGTPGKAAARTESFEGARR